MNLYDEKPKRKGASGRVCDSKMDEYEKYHRLNITLTPDQTRRLEAFCTDEERAKSWVIQKALDAYLTSKGY